MTERRPLIVRDGQIEEMPSGDTIPTAIAPGSGGLTNNFTAITVPTVGNDNTEGYAVGSRWVDITNDNSYTCVDNSTGAAVWVQENTEYPSFTNNAGKVLAVNNSENNVEWVNLTQATTIYTSTHWRITNFTEGSTSGNSIAEVVLRDENGATLTTSSVATFSQYNTSFSADKAVDGNASTLWSSNGLNAGEWFEFVFATAVNISALDITARNDSFAAQTPTDFDIQYSTDGGATFTTLGSTTEGFPNFTAGETKTFDVSALTIVLGNSTNLAEYSVANLPASPGTGAQALVSDSNSTTFGSIVVGGGTNPVPVYFDGTNWRIG